MKNKAGILFKVVTIITIVATLLIAVYIMVNGLGLQDSLDFGAGAYYYADIPEFDKYTDKSFFSTDIPYWIYMALSIVWGIVMYLLWKWIDKRGKK